MTKQCYNPYLPECEYIPDGEPYVFGNRLYVFGSHDAAGGEKFCVNDYVVWSAPTDDLSAWRCEGVIYRKTQDPRNADGRYCLYAPDVARGADGRYYLYYTLEDLGIMSVAVCDEPAGSYEYYGDVRLADGSVIGEREGDIYQFDPGIFVDEDGRIFLYSGFGIGEGAESYFRGLKPYGMYMMELEADMLTVKGEPKLLLPSNMQTSRQVHGFFEASSMRKINGRYYLIYSSALSHELCYMTSRYPDREFCYGGTLISIGDVGYHGRSEAHALDHLGNTHGSLVKIGEDWYIFYHRQTNRSNYSRQGCAEKIKLLESGLFEQAQRTSMGLNKGALAGTGTYPAGIACNLFTRNHAGYRDYRDPKAYALDARPFLTQEEPDVSLEEAHEGCAQHIAAWKNGGMIGYKFFELSNPKQVLVEISGDGAGWIHVCTELDEADCPAGTLAKISVERRAGRRVCSAKTVCAVSGVKPLYFCFEGEGELLFYSFTLE